MEFIMTWMYELFDKFWMIFLIISIHETLKQYLIKRYSLRTLDQDAYIGFEEYTTKEGILTVYRNNPLAEENKILLSANIEGYCKGFLQVTKARYKPTVLSFYGIDTITSGSPEEIMQEKKGDFYRFFMYVPLRDYLHNEYTSSLQDLSSSPTSLEKIAATHSLGLKLLDAASEYNVTLENFDESSIAKDIMHATAIQRVEVLVYLQNTQLINENEHKRYLENLESFRRFG
jgi:hypothetical protein